MKCPYCGAEESKVIDSRPTEDSERIRRRRECLNCHMRFTTYEVVETVPLIVIKKDNSREPFDRQKLLNAICLLYTSDAADDSLRVDLGGRRIIKK